MSDVAEKYYDMCDALACTAVRRAARRALAYYDWMRTGGRSGDADADEDGHVAAENAVQHRPAMHGKRLPSLVEVCNSDVMRYIPPPPEGGTLRGFGREYDVMESCFPSPYVRRTRRDDGKLVKVTYRGKYTRPSETNDCGERAIVHALVAALREKLRADGYNVTLDGNTLII